LSSKIQKIFACGAKKEDSVTGFAREGQPSAAQPNIGSRVE